MTTATIERRREMKFEPVASGGYRAIAYINGKVNSSHEPWIKDKEAAKDYLFFMRGYDCSPIDNVEVIGEDMEDDTKVRRFKYYGPHNLEEIVQYCTITEDRHLKIDDKAFVGEFNLSGLEKYLMTHYEEDIRKSMKSRNIKPVVITASAKKPVNRTNGSSAANHTSQATAFNRAASKPLDSVVIPPYVPDNAGFNAMSGFMVQDSDGSFKPNFEALVAEANKISPQAVEHVQNASTAYSNNDADSYRTYIKSVIQFVVSEMLKQAPDNVKVLMTNDIVANYMNRIYDMILEGSVQEINNRLGNEIELAVFVEEKMKEMIMDLITDPNADKDKIAELVSVFKNSELSDDVAVINEPEEPAVLDDKPVDNSAIIRQYPILGTVEKLITYNGTYGVKFKKDEYGLIQAAVFATAGTDDEAIEAKSFTMDLDGLIFDKDEKFWPGIEHTERPDFKKCYILSPEEIVRFRDGKDLGDPLFGGSLPKLNKYVDIRTLFSILNDSKDEDIELANKVLVETKKAMMPNDRIGKRFAKSRGIYTEATKVSETTFKFKIVFNDEYPRYVGGDPIKNTGGTGDLVVTVSTSEDNKESVTK